MISTGQSSPQIMAGNLVAKGRKLGYTPAQVRAIIKEQRQIIQREKLMQEVLDCNSVEDLKILLLDWIDKGMVDISI
jgi:hypothetical protein